MIPSRGLETHQIPTQETIYVLKPKATKKITMQTKWRKKMQEQNKKIIISSYSA